MWERVVESRLRKMVNISERQYGFVTLFNREKLWDAPCRTANNPGHVECWWTKGIEIEVGLQHLVHCCS